VLKDHSRVLEMAPLDRLQLPTAMVIRKHHHQSLSRVPRINEIIFLPVCVSSQTSLTVGLAAFSRQRNRPRSIGRNSKIF